MSQLHRAICHCVASKPGNGKGLATNKPREELGLNRTGERSGGHAALAP
jgi:hypothetical protein